MYVCMYQYCNKVATVQFNEHFKNIPLLTLQSSNRTLFPVGETLVISAFCRRLGQGQLEVNDYLKRAVSMHVLFYVAIENFILPLIFYRFDLSM